MSLMLGELMLHDVNAMEVEEVLKKRPFGQKILWTWRGGSLQVQSIDGPAPLV